MANMISSFLHPEDAFKDAAVPLEKNFNETKRNLTPFVNQGQQQFSGLNSAAQQLLNPQELMNKWTSGYETSPYAQRLKEMSMGSGLDAASSMGLMGSSGALANIQQMSSDITSKDRQQYIENLMKQYMEGIGLGKSLYETGANVATNLGGLSQKHGEDLAQLKYGESAAPGKLFENMVRTGASLYGMTPGGQANFPGYRFNGAEGVK